MNKRILCAAAFAAMTIVVGTFLWFRYQAVESTTPPRAPAYPAAQMEPTTRQRPPAEATVASIPGKILAGAKAQAIEATIYTPGYLKIAYPNGDVPRDTGVCADVIVRSLRCAGCDLQRLIHEDMALNFAAYPKKWGLSRPDSNIDHRRVPNQMCFFGRHGSTLTTDTTPKSLEQWRAGDFVYWKLRNGLDHCGVISDHRSADGMPLVVHNIDHCKEEDCLNRWRITGHFRYPGSR